VLYLERNQIGDIGARALAEVLLRAPAITELDLDYNSIGGEATSALRWAWGMREGFLLSL